MDNITELRKKLEVAWELIKQLEKENVALSNSVKNNFEEINKTTKNYQKELKKLTISRNDLQLLRTLAVGNLSAAGIDFNMIFDKKNGKLELKRSFRRRQSKNKNKEGRLIEKNELLGAIQKYKDRNKSSCQDRDFMIRMIVDRNWLSHNDLDKLLKERVETNIDTNIDTNADKIKN